eukprot:8059576-Alexandrium_andersonii.AAC.1
MRAWRRPKLQNVASASGVRNPEGEQTSAQERTRGHANNESHGNEWADPGCNTKRRRQLCQASTSRVNALECNAL